MKGFWLEIGLRFDSNWTLRKNNCENCFLKFWIPDTLSIQICLYLYGQNLNRNQKPVFIITWKMKYIVEWLNSNYDVSISYKCIEIAGALSHFFFYNVSFSKISCCFSILSAFTISGSIEHFQIYFNCFKTLNQIKHLKKKQQII